MSLVIGRKEDNEMSTDQVVRVHCNKCQIETKHLVLYPPHKQEGSEPPEENYQITWMTIYEILECAGCEEICIRRRFYFSEWNEGDVEETFYPPRIARALPRWFKDVDKNVAELMKETYQALQSSGHRLAMMGARALVDVIMVDKIGDVGVSKRS
jgi:hypothetical protein